MLRMSIDTSTSLGALVAERPGRARFFERLHLDYCCGGSDSLAEACARRGLDADTVAELLAALDESPARPDPAEELDWRRASIAELCDHIVLVHHANLRTELPRIAELLATVVRVHGKGHPELHDLERSFATMRADLEHHIDLEERVLFPACRGDAGATLDTETLTLLEHEHTDTGRSLTALRELANDYDRERALCATHRTLLDALQRLELDLHQHIHEENNLLFPRVHL